MIPNTAHAAAQRKQVTMGNQRLPENLKKNKKKTMEAFKMMNQENTKGQVSRLNVSEQELRAERLRKIQRERHYGEQAYAYAYAYAYAGL